MHHWHEAGPAARRAEAGPLRIDAIPGQWSAPASNVQEHFPGITHRPAQGHFLRITRRRDGEVLADLRRARTSELVAEPDLAEGRIHVRFGLRLSDQILILDPGAERCRLAGGEWQPFSAMQSLVDAALARMRDMGPRHQVHSSDGRIRIDYFEYEHRNNEWLPSPEILDLERGDLVLKETHWISNAHHEWKGPGRFVLTVANAFLPELVVRFDLDARTVRLGDEGRDQPIADARALIERWVRRQERWIEAPPLLRPRSFREALRSYVRGYDWRVPVVALAIVGPFMLYLACYGGLV